MPTIHCHLSHSLWRALHTRQQATGESLDHLIRTALADYLQVQHSTLFQVSTSGALVEGIYKGEVSIATLKAHGDFGLGTFEGLDGEMVVLDGRFYQVQSDGKVSEVDDEVRTPFAVITRFVPERTVDVTDCPTFAALMGHLDRLRQSNNVFFAIRADGEFEYVRTRAMCKTEEGIPLVQAAAVQPEFESHGVTGTLVGFWTPEYVKTLNVAGYHFHFLTDDRLSGGHLLDCSARRLRIQIQHEGDFRMSLPESQEFLKADLSRDPSTDMDKAER